MSDEPIDEVETTAATTTAVCPPAAGRLASTSRTRSAGRSSRTRCRSSSAARLPDVRDGLKPVHRRILYAMNQEGLLPNRALLEVGRCRRRSAQALPPPRRQRGLRLDGPDGPGLLAPLSARRRPGQLRHPSTAIRRPPTATPRPDSRRSPRRCSATSIAQTVDFAAELRRPDGRADRSFRPASRICWPTASSGIAVGMATNIPPHNLRELTAALVLEAENPDCTRGRTARADARPRLSDRRVALRHRRHPELLRDGSRPPDPACAGRVRGQPSAVRGSS